MSKSIHYPWHHLFLLAISRLPLLLAFLLPFAKANLHNDIVNFDQDHGLPDFGSRPQRQLKLPTNPPSDYEVPDFVVEDDNTKEGNAKKTANIYYNVTAVHSNDEKAFANAYVDIADWINQGSAEGKILHSHLDGAYRQAGRVQLKFQFPFYGNFLRNLTIATGGFLYVGDQTHSYSWLLAADQYIAPLMANFDTLQNQSTILYADDGNRMIVEWKDVTLRDNRAAGNFTFQVHLWRNGNITFVYKEVPIPVGQISGSQRPSKIGISDAFLFIHTTRNSWLSPPKTTRVVHQFRRIAIPTEKIASKTVIFLKALPTCLDATSCGECLNKQMGHSKCSWCTPLNDPDSNGPFCMDQLGLHRRKEEWLEGHCMLPQDIAYCQQQTEDSIAKQ